MSTKIYKKYIDNFEANLLECKFLGSGHNGAVYLLPDGKVIKICFSKKSCKKEYDILKKIKTNKFFPKVYGMSGNYMIRDFVDGERFDSYIRRNGLDKSMALKLIELLEEFEKLNFAKKDIRCKDILVDPEGHLRVIDPKKFYTKKREFPKHLQKGLEHLGVLDFFMTTAKENRNKLYKKWLIEKEKFLKEKSEKATDFEND